MPASVSVPASTTKRFAAAIGCGLVVVLASLITRPWVDVSLLDDFSYIWTARVLADTGHVVYNGWSTAMLGWQLYLGVAFIKLFGFSIVKVHASMLLVAFANAVLLQRIFVRLQLSERNATFATLVLCLSPLHLVLVFSFMSDLPGLFALLFCLYACLRALSAESDRAAFLWLAVAALGNDVAGTARQIAWLGALVMAPSAAWMMRKRRGALAVGAILWLVSAIIIAGCMHWLKAQPYTLNEKLFLGFSGWPMIVQMQISSALTLMLYCLPVTIGFLLPRTEEKDWMRSLLWIGGVSALLTAWLVKSHRDFLAPFSPGWLTVKGLTVSVPGDEPTLFSLPVQIVLTFMTFAAFLAFLRTLALWLRKENGSEAKPLWLRSPMMTLLGPFTAAYFVLSFTRRPIFDRYLLMLLIIFMAVALRIYQDRYDFKGNWANYAAAAVFAVVAVVTLHDLYALSRGALAAATQLRSAGVPRAEFHASGEYDAWTQLEINGFVNDPRLKVPAGAYRPTTPPPIDPRCLGWFAHIVPDIHARYGVYTTPLNCLSAADAATSSAAPVGTVEYETWLPPRKRHLYILPMSPR